jgi:hypothetical protein
LRWYPSRQSGTLRCCSRHVRLRLTMP